MAEQRPGHNKTPWLPRPNILGTKSEHVPEPMCNHSQQPVDVGDTALTIVATESFNKRRTDRATPILGVYLDSVWTPRPTFECYGGLKLPDHPSRTDYPSVVVDWPDHGIIDTGDLTVLLKLIEGYRKRKGVIEIGCVGGHGRTGTMLAELCVWFGKMGPAEAIAHVRGTYCKKAIESYQQESALYLWAGEEPPPKPQVKKWSLPAGQQWQNDLAQWEKQFNNLGGYE